MPRKHRHADVVPHRLALYGTRLGLRALAASRDVDGGFRRDAAWSAWMPVDIDRVVELPWAARVVEPGPGRRVLDVGSPKLLACWLAERTGAEVVATDIWEREIESWRRLTRAADPSGARFRTLRLEAADARRLPYETASFDSAYSVSVVEHVQDEGDSEVLAELERVVRPGGLVALTFPYRERFEEEYVERDLYGEEYRGEPIFFQRAYSSETVDARLLAGREFDVIEREIWTKVGVRRVQGPLGRVVPRRWEVGRMLGPLLPAVGAVTMRPGTLDLPAPDNTMRLLLRRR